MPFTTRGSNCPPLKRHVGGSCRMPVHWKWTSSGELWESSSALLSYLLLLQQHKGPQIQRNDIWKVLADSVSSSSTFPISLDSWEVNAVISLTVTRWTGASSLEERDCSENNQFLLKMGFDQKTTVLLPFSCFWSFVGNTYHVQISHKKMALKYCFWLSLNKYYHRNVSGGDGFSGKFYPNHTTKYQECMFWC